MVSESVLKGVSATGTALVIVLLCSQVCARRCPQFVRRWGAPTTAAGARIVCAVLMHADSCGLESHSYDEAVDPFVAHPDHRCVPPHLLSSRCTSSAHPPCDVLLKHTRAIRAGQGMNFVSWLIYAIVKGDSALLVVNIIGACFTAIYLTIFFIFNKAAERKTLFVYLISIILITVGINVGILVPHLDHEQKVQALGAVAVAWNVVMYAAPLSQVVRSTPSPPQTSHAATYLRTTRGFGVHACGRMCCTLRREGHKRRIVRTDSARVTQRERKCISLRPRRAHAARIHLHVCTRAHCSCASCSPACAVPGHEEHEPGGHARAADCNRLGVLRVLGVVWYFQW
ncbi:hypothetical protein EON66_08305 [archaeon]|nr:MAG: hypothetical protein EON66_08305 [archaeon]